jgi:hypothetical protein
VKLNTSHTYKQLQYSKFKITHAAVLLIFNWPLVVWPPTATGLTRTALSVNFIRIWPQLCRDKCLYSIKLCAGNPWHCDQDELANPPLTSQRHLTQGHNLSLSATRSLRGALWLYQILCTLYQGPLFVITEANVIISIVPSRKLFTESESFFDWNNLSTCFFWSTHYNYKRICFHELITFIHGHCFNQIICIENE